MTASDYTQRELDLIHKSLDDGIRDIKSAVNVHSEDIAKLMKLVSHNSGAIQRESKDRGDAFEDIISKMKSLDEVKKRTAKLELIVLIALAFIIGAFAHEKILDIFVKIIL